MGTNITNSIYNQTFESHTSNTTFTDLLNNTLFNNGTEERCATSEKEDIGIKVLKGIFLSACIICAIGGNLLVCAAVLTERRLKRVKNNYFIVSLAVADLLVALVVMTFAVANELIETWVFGQVWCNIWICFDIMCSSASILNLCVISLDRYIHIHNAMYYDAWMTTRKALFFIVLVWFLSAIISFLPIHMGWHEGSPSPNDLSGNQTLPDTLQDEDPCQCTLTLNFVYALVSSTISFYVPCLVMLVIYFKLFLFARQHAVSIRSLKRTTMVFEKQNAVSNGSTYNKPSLRSTASDHKAAFTLGIITGVFLICWLPFFIINPIAAYNPNLIPIKLFNIFTWAGYANSCLNPVIYSIFNTEFREAFKRILSGHTCRRDGAFLPSPSRTSKNARKKFLKTEPQPAGNGSSRKTSTDPLVNDKITQPPTALTSITKV